MTRVKISTNMGVIYNQPYTRRESRYRARCAKREAALARQEGLQRKQQQQQQQKYQQQQRKTPLPPPRFPTPFPDLGRASRQPTHIASRPDLICNEKVGLLDDDDQGVITPRSYSSDQSDDAYFETFLRLWEVARQLKLVPLRDGYAADYA